jgi:uncharacterized protein YhbP (UPF0306 family)
VSTRRIAAAARRLLEASTLCTISTVSAGGRPHANTAYFSWNRSFDLVWLSDPGSTHSRHLRTTPSAAVVVYDSRQTWGEADRGIQLFGSASEATGSARREAERSYARRFPDYTDAGDYRFYRFRPRRLKLFDETVFGSGVFVSAAVRGGDVAWTRTDVVGA